MDRDDEYYDVPFYAYRTALPEGRDFKVANAAYKPAIESLVLRSEQGRNVFAEAIIENRRLGTLADLCLGALGHHYGTLFRQMVARDERSKRLYYDSIDVDSPLENIYQIDDKLFWKRLVLAKSTDRSLELKDDSFDWKSLGISLKYVELVEQCPAEFWPEKQMESLAEMVKGHVKEMHIKELKPLQDYSFDRYLLRESDTDKSDSTDVSSSTPPEVETTESKDEDIGEEEEDGFFTPAPAATAVKSESSSATSSGILTPETARTRMEEAEWNVFAERRNEQKLKFMEERKEERRRRREAQQRRRERRESKIAARREMALAQKPKRIIVRNIYDLPDEPSEDLESKIVDKRNMAKYLEQKKNYDYPPRHCHHIDLRFVRLFENLEEFSIVFHPPKVNDKFHARYFKFSYDDIDRLARGIREVQTLRIFRLRESRMDDRKLRILASVLKDMNVEVIDLGFNFLDDNCDDAIWNLFQNTTTTIKSLELEGNYINGNVLRCLAYALRDYEGHLEYLGLSRNPIDAEAIHSLCRILPHTNQIEHLNLTGVKLSSTTLKCCIADELLRRHKTLRKLDLVGVPIDAGSAEEIIKALEFNYNVMHLDFRGCDLSFEIEFEIEVCVRRNRYMADNPYIGSDGKTEEEIKGFCTREKNPILIKVTEAMEARRLCMINRSDIICRSRTTSTANVTERPASVFSVFESERSVQSENVIDEEPFDYRPNEFNLEQIQKQVDVPGPGQRYYYLRSIRRWERCLANIT